MEMKGRLESAELPEESQEEAEGEGGERQGEKHWRRKQRGDVGGGMSDFSVGRLIHHSLTATFP